MQDIKVMFSIEQVKALLQISQNQLFRLRFLDPKMPGYKPRAGELESAESAVKVLEAALKASKASDGGWNKPTPKTHNIVVHRAR